MYKEYPKIFKIYNNQKHRPNGAAAFGGRPIGSVFLFILYHRYLWISLIYSLYIPYIFPKYVPYIFPCVFLNLFRHQKKNLFKFSGRLYKARNL